MQNTPGLPQQHLQSCFGMYSRFTTIVTANTKWTPNRARIFIHVPCDAAALSYGCSLECPVNVSDLWSLGVDFDWGWGGSLLCTMISLSCLFLVGGRYG